MLNTAYYTRTFVAFETSSINQCVPLACPQHTFAAFSGFFNEIDSILARYKNKGGAEEDGDNDNGDNDDDSD